MRLNLAIEIGRDEDRWLERTINVPAEVLAIPDIILNLHEGDKGGATILDWVGITRVEWLAQTGTLDAHAVINQGKLSDEEFEAGLLKRGWTPIS